MNVKQCAAFTILAAGIALLCFGVDQDQFLRILLGYSIAFSGYTYLFSNPFPVNKLSIAMATISVVIAIVAFPNLSDDIYRFIWDGYCIHNQISPYTSLPSELVDSGLVGLDKTLFDQLNSPNYYSIYPTVSQAFFFLAIWMSDTISTQTTILQMIYATLHIIGFYLTSSVLQMKGLNPRLIWLYFLNPLVIVEGIGNLHAEINMVSLSMMSLYFWMKNQLKISSLFLSLAIAVKLIPIFLLGYFLFRWKSAPYRKFFMWTFFWTTLLFIPVFYGLVSGGFLDSIDLYFRKFEFNASLYYLFREVGYIISGYNLIAYIGPLLFVGFVGTAFGIWINNRDTQSFFQQSLLILTIYLFCSTIIHPWYLIGLCALNIFTNLRYILAWSFLITLTYINYSFVPYEEQIWIVAIEYTIVFILMYFEKNNWMPLLRRPLLKSKE